MHVTITAVKTWTTAGSLAAAAFFSGGVSAEVLPQQPAPSTEQPSADRFTVYDLHRALEQRVTMDLKNAVLEDVIQAIRKQCTLPIVVAPDLDARNQPLVTMKTEDQCLREVLDDIIKQAGLHYVLANHALYLSSAPIPHVAGGGSSDAGLESENSRKLERRMTFNVENQDFFEFLRLIREECKVMIVISPSVAAIFHPLVTKKAKDKRARDVLNEVLKNNGLSYMLMNQAVYVYSD